MKFVSDKFFTSLLPRLEKHSKKLNDRTNTLINRVRSSACEKEHLHKPEHEFSTLSKKHERLAKFLDAVWSLAEKGLKEKNYDRVLDAIRDLQSGHDMSAYRCMRTSYALPLERLFETVSLDQKDINPGDCMGTFNRVDSPRAMTSELESIYSIYGGTRGSLNSEDFNLLRETFRQFKGDYRQNAYISLSTALDSDPELTMEFLRALDLTKEKYPLEELMKIEFKVGLIKNLDYLEAKGCISSANKEAALSLAGELRIRADQAIRDSAAFNIRSLMASLGEWQEENNIDFNEQQILEIKKKLDFSSRMEGAFEVERYYSSINEMVSFYMFNDLEEAYARSLESDTRQLTLSRPISCHFSDEETSIRDLELDEAWKQVKDRVINWARARWRTTPVCGFKLIDSVKDSLLEKNAL